MRSNIIYLVTLLWCARIAHASNADSHAPIQVMGDHLHGRGEIMLSYRYMNMSMEGNQNEGTSLSTSDVHNDYMIAPLKMTTQMHMLGMMAAPSNDVTLMTMLTYVKKSMDLQALSGTEFTTESKGMGDTQLSAIIRLLKTESTNLHFNFGVNLPTGSIDARDDTPLAADSQLPYPMQLGSGTFDLLPGVTFREQLGDFSLGSQVSTVLRLGKNSRGYRFGNRASFTTWGSYLLGKAWSTSLRIKADFWGNVKDQDDALNASLVPTANPKALGGKRIDLGIGVNFLGTSGFLEGHRIAAEFLLPVYQFLFGPQLKTEWMIVVGWQFALPSTDEPHQH